MLILSKSIFDITQNGILGFSIPHLVPEIFRFLKYAYDVIYSERLNKIHKNEEYLCKEQIESFETLHMYANEDSRHHCLQYVVAKETAGKQESFN